jgi:membrane-associated phospholipid phosphatase
MSPLYLFIFTTVASTAGYVFASLAVTLYFAFKRRMVRMWAFVISATGLLFFTELLKNTFQTQRPADALIETFGYAFPSGHAAGSVFLALTLCYFARTLKNPLRYLLYILLAVAALAIGYSRFELRVHTPFQIGAGHIVGIVFALACILAIRHFEKKR